MAEAPEYSKCPEHGKDIVLFCNETECQVAICTACLTKKHLCHKVVEIEEVNEVRLFKNIEVLTKNLQRNISLLSTVKRDIKEKGDVCVAQIHKYWQASNDYFKRTIQQAEKEIEKEHKNIDDCLAAMETSVDGLSDIKKSVGAQEEKNFAEIMSKSEEVRKITDSCEPYLSGYKTFRYPVYFRNTLLPEKITQQKTTINFSNKDEDENRPAIFWDPVFRAEQMKERLVNFTGTELPLPDWRNVLAVEGLSDNSVVVCHNKGGSDTTLSRFGKDIAHVKIPHFTKSMVEVQLNGKQCLAMMIHGEKESLIDFRDIQDLNKVVFTYKFGQSDKAFLCSGSTSCLLCAHVPKTSIVRSSWTLSWLDCKGPEPETTQTKVAESVWSTIYGISLDDVSLVNLAGKKLLVCLNPEVRDRSIVAYDMDTLKKKWTINSENFGTFDPRALSADPHGLLFVCGASKPFVYVSRKKGNQTTRNDCIQMFSALDGKHLGYLIQDEGRTLWEPINAKWHQQSSSLIITNIVQQQCRIKLIKC